MQVYQLKKEQNRKSSTESNNNVLSFVDVTVGTITDLACVSNEGFTGDIDTDSDGEDEEEEQSNHHISTSISGTTFLFVYQEPWQQSCF